MIKKKMDKIDHRLTEMYKNWHAEYGNVNTLEECEECDNRFREDRRYSGRRRYYQERGGRPPDRENNQG